MNDKNGVSRSVTDNNRKSPNVRMRKVSQVNLKIKETVYIDNQSLSKGTLFLHL